MNLSPQWFSENTLFKRAIAADLDFSRTKLYLASEESLAISKEADIPLPETSPKMIAIDSSGNEI